MSDRNKAVFAIFKSRAQAERGIELLKIDGFMNLDISVLLPNISGSQDFIHSKESKAPEGAQRLK